MTLKDINKTIDFALATKDGEGRLMVGAAVGNGEETEERIDALVNAGVNVLVVDSAHGHSKGIIERVEAIKKDYPELQLIAGNVATGAGALKLVEAGADAIKVGIGPGSICTTRIVTGVGVPQVSAVAEVTQALKKKDIPIIADATSALQELISEIKKLKFKQSENRIGIWLRQIDEWRKRKCLDFNQTDKIIKPQYAIQRLYEKTREMYSFQIG